MAEALYDAYRVRKIGFTATDAPFVGRANRVSLHGVDLHYCRYDTPIHIEFAEMDGFRQFFCLSGAGSIRVAGRQLDIDQTVSGVIPPRSRFEAAYGPSYQHLVVQFSEQSLLRKAELITGRPIRGSLRMAKIEASPVEQLLNLRTIAILLAHQFSRPMDVNNLVVVELCQALTSSFLMDNLDRFPDLSSERPAMAGPRDANRLEDYIHAHWDQPLSVEQVADACGMSVRSVFARFKQDRGVSPMAYIRDVRLDHAQRLLTEGDGALSVIDVALRCGFSSFGHFARRYRDRFGELPSTTAARRRRASR
jgi:AraC-like DNA-binding protein